jgi:hypothetical protein
MEIELCPLNLGEILDRIFYLYRARFLTFVGIASLAAALNLLWQIVQTFCTRSLLDRHILPKLVTLLSSLSWIVTLGVTVIASALALAAINRAVSALYLGRRTGIAQAFSEVWPRWFRYICVNLTALLIAWGPAVLLLFGSILLVLLAPRISGLRAANVLTGAVALIGLALLAVVPLGVWGLLRYSLAIAACTFEDTNVRQSLKRSAHLSKNTRWRILVMLLISVAAQMLMGILFVFPAFPFMAPTPGHVPLGISVYFVAVGFISNLLVTPIYGIGLTLFYYDARIRKEGFDIHWMLQRAVGVSPLSEETS